jgi:hypothetical protein
MRFRIGNRDKPARRLASLAAAEKANAAAKDQVRQVSHASLNARGALRYRAGPSQEEALRGTMAFHPQGGELSGRLDLARAEHALGRTDAAKAAAVRARAARPSPRTGTAWERAEVVLLAAELDSARPLPRK